MHREMKESIESKEVLIRDKLPAILIESMNDVEDSVATIVDLWTYHN